MCYISLFINKQLYIQGTTIVNKEESNNNSRDNSTTKELSLAFYCRWLAFCKRYNKLSIDEGKAFVESQPNYIRRWLIDGVGTPYATVTNSDVGDAISYLDSIGYSINEIISDVVVIDRESNILLLEYCLSVS